MTSNSFNESLIALIHKVRPIWDPKHRDYKDRVVVQQAWLTVARKLETPVDTVRQKWKNLKDYYRNELRKAKRQEERQLEDSSVAARKSSWPHYEQLAFLQDTIRFRPMPPERPATNVVLVNGSPAHSDSIERATEDFKIEYDNEAEEVDENSKQYQELQPVDHQDDYMDYTNPGGSTSRKQVGSLLLSDPYGEDVECKRIKLMFEKEEDFDEDLLFFKSLLPDFRLLPRTSKMALKVKFQHLLYEETLAAAGQTS